MKPYLTAINNRIKDLINTASEYRHIKRIGVIGFYRGNELYAGSRFNEPGILDLIYDCDEESDGAKDELLEYIEDMDMFVRHILGLFKVGFICYTNTHEPENDVIWIYDKRISEHETKRKNSSHILNCI